MRTREFWALDGDDRGVIDRLEPGVGDDGARVLAYLLLRAELEDDPATELVLRIGTGLNRSAITSAIDRLESAGVLERTTVRTDAPGRPPAAWHPIADGKPVARRLYRHHAGRLLEHAREMWGVDPTSEPRTTEERLSLGLNWHPNGLHVPFYAAKRSNRFEEFALSVDIEHHGGSRQALDAVLSGAADVGLVGAATVARARAAGEPVVPIGVAYQRAMAVLYTTRETFGEALTGVERLRGRRIGMPARSETRVLGRLFLNQVALDGSVRIVDTTGEERNALLSGDVDVVTGSFSDPRELERRDMTVDTLAVADHFPIYGPTLVVRERTLSARDRLLQGFLAGTTAGWADARLDAMPAATRIADLAGSSPDRVIRTFEEASREFGGGEAVSENGWGWQREATWERLRTALEQGALLSEPEDT